MKQLKRITQTTPSHVIPSSKSAGDASARPRARITIVSSRGERLQHSNRLTSLRFRPQLPASASWERPARYRCRRRLAANCSRTALMASTPAGDASGCNASNYLGGEAHVNTGCLEDLDCAVGQIPLIGEACVST